MSEQQVIDRTEEGTTIRTGTDGQRISRRLFADTDQCWSHAKYRGKRMRIVMFYQTLVSDWNHGNAHFLRGVAK